MEIEQGGGLRSGIPRFRDLHHGEFVENLTRTPVFSGVWGLAREAAREHVLRGRVED